MGETLYYLLKKMEHRPGRHEGPSLLSMIKRWSHFVITTIELTLISGTFLKSFFVACLLFYMELMANHKLYVKNSS